MRSLGLLVSLISLIFLFCDYPKNSVVAITIVHNCAVTEPIDLFAKPLLERCKKVAQKKQDFRVVEPIFYNETNTFPNEVTHYIEVRLDTIFLLKIPDDLRRERDIDSLVYDKFKRAQGKREPTIYVTGINRDKFVNYDMLFSRLGISKKTAPFIGAEVSLFDKNTKERIWHEPMRVETKSTIVIPAYNQLSELLSMIRNNLYERLPYLKM